MIAPPTPRWRITLSHSTPADIVADAEDVPGVRKYANSYRIQLSGGLGSLGWALSVLTQYGVQYGWSFSWERAPAPMRTWEELREIYAERREFRDFVFAENYLWRWQIDATCAASRAPGFMFWHPPGSGKTLTAMLRAFATEDPIIVAAPAKVRRQWGKAIEYYTAIKPYVFKPESQRRKRDISPTQYLKLCTDENRRPFMIGGIEALRGWGQEVKGLNLGQFGLIIDEIHRLRSDARWESTHFPEPKTKEERDLLEASVRAKGGTLKVNTSEEGVVDYVGLFPAGSRAKMAEDLSRLASWRLGLTGTRVWNAPKDLWGQLDLIFPGEFGGKGTTFKRGFAQRYCDGKEGAYGGIEKKGATNQQELAVRLIPLNHTVDDAEVKRHLPAARREVYYIPEEELTKPSSGFKARMKEAQKKRSRSAELWVNLAETATRKRGVVLDLVQERIERGPQKILIFTGTREDCDGLAAYLRKHLPEDVDVWGAHGGHPQTAREALRVSYAGHPGPCVLVGTWDAWGEGVDGLQSTDLFIAVMLPWCPGVFIQGERRVNRGGQDRPVLLIYLVASGTVEEHVIENILPKGAAMATLGVSEFKDIAKLLISPESEEGFAQSLFDCIPDDVEFEDD